MMADSLGSQDEYHGYVGVQRRGVIARPADLRQRLHLDEPGAQLEVTEGSDGVIQLRPALPVPADQAWFWTERWEQREREVQEYVGTGRVSVHESGKAFLAHLDDLDGEIRPRLRRARCRSLYSVAGFPACEGCPWSSWCTRNDVVLTSSRIEGHW